jgi:glutamate synthase domain-containing protein 1
MTGTIYDHAHEHDACGVGMVADLKRRVSHSIVSDALTILENLEHRGASGADPNSGDGAGVMLAMPNTFLRRVAGESGVTLPDMGQYAVAVWFLDKQSSSQNERDSIAKVFADRGMATTLMAPDSGSQRPTRRGCAGERARAVDAVHCSFADVDDSEFERHLDVARKLASRLVGAYAASCSARTVIYKGMLTSSQLRHYFADLRDPDLATSMALACTLVSRPTHSRRGR